MGSVNCRTVAIKESVGLNVDDAVNFLVKQYAECLGFGHGGTNGAGSEGEKKSCFLAKVEVG